MFMIGNSPKGFPFRPNIYSVQVRPDLRYLRTMLFGVYLLIRKRAVLRYIYRLLAVYVSLLANIGVF